SRSRSGTRLDRPCRASSRARRCGPAPPLPCGSAPAIRSARNPWAVRLVGAKNSMGRRGLPGGAVVGMLTAMNETTPAIQDYLGAIYDLPRPHQTVIGARPARPTHA